MKGKRKQQVEDEPALETETYRTWGAKAFSPKEREALKQTCLGIYPGERIHEAVVFNVRKDHVLKVLSKERIRDGRISVVLKFESSGDRCRVFKPKGWIKRDRYDRFMGRVRKLLGERECLVTPGEDFHIGLAQVLGHNEKKQRRTVRGRKAPDCPLRGGVSGRRPRGYRGERLFA